MMAATLVDAAQIVARSAAYALFLMPPRSADREAGADRADTERASGKTG